MFLEICHQYINSAVETATDDRRHGSVEVNGRVPLSRYIIFIVKINLLFLVLVKPNLLQENFFDKYNYLNQMFNHENQNRAMQLDKCFSDINTALLLPAPSIL